MRLTILSRRSSLYSTRRLLESAAARGYDTVVVDPLRCHLVVEREHPRIYRGDDDVSASDVVIPRIASSITEHGLAVVDQYELLGVPVVNGSAAITRARDKLRCLQVLARNGLPVPRTLMARNLREVRRFLDEIGGPPVVLKLPRGTQGVGVILAETRESLGSILETLWGMGQSILVQQFIQEARGRDLRLLVLGGKLVATMERQASGNEFRANIHRGGAGLAFRPTAQVRRLAVDAARALGLQLAGVDLVVGSDGPIIIEVNASPGLEELEHATRSDLAGRVIDFAARLAAPLRAAG